MEEGEDEGGGSRCSIKQKDRKRVVSSHGAVSGGAASAYGTEWGDSENYGRKERERGALAIEGIGRGRILSSND